MKRMKRIFIIKQMTKKKKKNSKIVFTSQKKIKNPGPTLQCPRCFLEAGSSKESERGRFGAGDKHADRRGCELSGAGERDRDQLGMPEEDSTAGVVSGTRKSPVACDVTGVGGSTWTFGIALGGGMV